MHLVWVWFRFRCHLCKQADSSVCVTCTGSGFRHKISIMWCNFVVWHVISTMFGLRYFVGVGIIGVELFLSILWVCKVSGTGAALGVFLGRTVRYCTCV